MSNDAPLSPMELQEQTPLSLKILGIGVRVVGIVVLLVGMWAGIRIIYEAVSLYQEPARIERFAEAIQNGSNIDTSLSNVIDKALDKNSSQESESEAKGQNEGLRVSYFAAWLITLLLMFVIGSLAMTAITTGGQLVLYDLQVRQYSRAMLREWRRS